MKVQIFVFASCFILGIFSIRMSESGDETSNNENLAIVLDTLFSKNGHEYQDSLINFYPEEYFPITTHEDLDALDELLQKDDYKDKIREYMMVPPVEYIPFITETMNKIMTPQLAKQYCMPKIKSCEEKTILKNNIIQFVKDAVEVVSKVYMELIEDREIEIIMQQWLENAATKDPADVQKKQLSIFLKEIKN